jgi:hypothetical protein
VARSNFDCHQKGESQNKHPKHFEAMKAFHFIRFNVFQRLQAMMKNEKSQQNFGNVFFCLLFLPLMRSEGPRIFALKKEEEDFCHLCPQKRCNRVDNISDEIRILLNELWVEINGNALTIESLE